MRCLQQQNLSLADKVKAIAQAKGCSPGQLSMAWLLAKAPDVVPIPGTKSMEYLEDNVGAAGVSLTAEEVAALEAAVPASEVVGDRYGDMGHLTYKGGHGH